MNKIYEFETNRSNISPKQFYTWCEREFKKRTGNDLSIWLDSFEQWVSPCVQYPYSRTEHQDGVTEVCKVMPYEHQLYLQSAYNFIMEYWDGHGYCYIVEYER